MLVTSHCNFSNFICAGGLCAVTDPFLGKHWTFYACFAHKYGSFGCSYKLWFTLLVSVYICTVCFSSHCHPFMLLPQPILHNANTDTRMEIVQSIRDDVVQMQHMLVIMFVHILYHHLWQLGWCIVFHWFYTLLIVGGGSSCTSSHCTMFCAMLCTADGVSISTLASECFHAYFRLSIVP